MTIDEPRGEVEVLCIFNVPLLFRTNTREKNRDIIKPLVEMYKFPKGIIHRSWQKMTMCVIIGSRGGLENKRPLIIDGKGGECLRRNGLWRILRSSVSLFWFVQNCLWLLCKCSVIKCNLLGSCTPPDYARRRTNRKANSMSRFGIWIGSTVTFIKNATWVLRSLISAQYFRLIKTDKSQVFDNFLQIKVQIL
jgi:hypothetical protein